MTVVVSGDFDNLTEVCEEYLDIINSIELLNDNFYGMDGKRSETHNKIKNIIIKHTGSGWLKSALISTDKYLHNLREEVTALEIRETIADFIYWPMNH